MAQHVVTEAERDGDSGAVPALRYTGALLKVAGVFDALESETWLSASDLAQRIGVDRSTAYRLAQAMTRLGWLRQGPDRKTYRLGLRLWELGARAIADLEVRAIAVPHMREVVEATGESCDLAILDGSDIVYIEKIDGTHEVRAYTQIGQRVPAHAVAMGKALMSCLDPSERARRLPPTLLRYTPLTADSLEEFNRRCDEVGRLGYAINVGEYNPEAGGLAVPIKDWRGQCIAAVGINVPTVRMTDENVVALAPVLLAAGKAIAHECGYVGS